MKIFVGVTDGEWFRLLRSLPELDEVNFWQPSGSNRFRALDPGEPFLFKLHSPQNYIVGGGFFATFSLLPVQLAWEIFGEKNGARSLEEMRQRVGKYRRASVDRRENHPVGCIVLTQPFFFPESEWIPIPADWASNIVRGKTYQTAEAAGRKLWDDVLLQLRAVPVSTDPDLVAERPMMSDPVLMRRRLGQGAFRVLITDNYQRRCAVTQEKALPVLEAAHILPVGEGGLHQPENGVLLRSDVHRLYDAGYVTVTPDYRFRVSSRLKTDFDNGEPYYPFDGREIWLPKKENLRPNRQLLERHADEVFLR